jgi:hypothetical protein
MGYSRAKRAAAIGLAAIASAAAFWVQGALVSLQGRDSYCAVIAGRTINPMNTSANTNQNHDTASHGNRVLRRGMATIDRFGGYWNRYCSLHSGMEVALRPLSNAHEATRVYETRATTD